MQETDPKEGRRNLYNQSFDSLLGLCLALSLFLLLLGWTLPVMTVETFFVFEDRITIAGALSTLLDEGEAALFAIVFIFTMAFPTAKLCFAYLAWRHLHNPAHKLHKTVERIELIGRWSMMDVFVIALFVVVLKLSLLSDVRVEPGLYIFAAGVIASILTVRRIIALARRSLSEKGG